MRNEEGFSMYDLRKFREERHSFFHLYLNLANMNNSLGLQSEDEDEDEDEDYRDL